MRDLRHRGGGFYSAEDADSLDPDGHPEEGRFYTWTRAELDQTLGPLADVAAEWWGVTEGGNFEGRSILHRPERADLLRPADVERARRELFDEREGRPRPGLDDKVLTEWNALMLATLAEAGAATANRVWLDAAVANGEFLLTNLRREDGRWLRSWQADDGGRAKHLAVAADHAALIDAFTRLAEATGEARWIEAARGAADDLIRLFGDPVAGGFFTTGEDAERLIARSKDVLDNATPSANGLAAVALVRLAALTGDTGYRAKAEGVIGLLAKVAEEHPTAVPSVLTAIDLLAGGPTEVAVVGDAPELVSAVLQRYLPEVVLAWEPPSFSIPVGINAAR